MPVLIKNLRNETPVNEWDIKVDRSSVLGNPFRMGEASRDMVCNQYEQYFYKQIENGDVFAGDVRRLIDIYRRYGELNLFCWCAPKRCHAETIKNYIEASVIGG